MDFNKHSLIWLVLVLAVYALWRFYLRPKVDEWGQKKDNDEDKKKP